MGCATVPGPLAKVPHVTHTLSPFFSTCTLSSQVFIILAFSLTQRGVHWVVGRPHAKPFRARLVTELSKVFDSIRV